MSEPLSEALARVRSVLLDPHALVRAVGAGRRRAESPPWRRVELRYVDLKGGRRLQVVTFDDTQSFTANHDAEAATQAVDTLLAMPFGNWHVETVDGDLALRVTKKGAAVVSAQSATREQHTRHDRVKSRLLPPDDPVLIELGITDSQGRVKPSREAKYRQVEEFVRLLDRTVLPAIGHQLRTPTPDDPLRIVDLGCGNAYLTFAAHAHLTRSGVPVHVTGVDTKAQSREHNTAVAQRLGISASFVQGGIDEVQLDPAPEVVLALHACDTATDDALARAVAWEAPVVLAAPCCHHDLAAQLRGRDHLLIRDGILRERLADTLTDALRAGLLRERGYRVDVVEFVGSEHTPRNTLLRAVRTGHRGPADALALAEQWQVRPRLAELLER